MAGKKAMVGTSVASRKSVGWRRREGAVPVRRQRVMAMRQ
jgi:hypothetical protein